MLPVINWRDPRLQPCAYVARGKQLFEVLEVNRTKGVLVEDCRSLELLRVGPREIVPGWRLVKAAPVELGSLEDAA